MQDWRQDMNLSLLFAFYLLSNYVKKKKEKKRRDVTISTKVVMWGGGPDVVTRAKLHQIGSGVLAPWGVEICHFFLSLALAYITG